MYGLKDRMTRPRPSRPLTPEQYLKDRSPFGPTGPTEALPGNVRCGGNVRVEQLAPSRNFARIYDGEQGRVRFVELAD